MTNYKKNLLARLQARLIEEGSDALQAVYTTAKFNGFGEFARQVQGEARASGIFLV
jgi:hypothetical protein